MTPDTGRPATEVTEVTEVTGGADVSGVARIMATAGPAKPSKPPRAREAPRPTRPAKPARPATSPDTPKPPKTSPPPTALTTPAPETPRQPHHPRDRRVHRPPLPLGLGIGTRLPPPPRSTGRRRPHPLAPRLLHPLRPRRRPGPRSRRRDRLVRPLRRGHQRAHPRPASATAEPRRRELLACLAGREGRRGAGHGSRRPGATAAAGERVRARGTGGHPESALAAAAGVPGLDADRLAADSASPEVLARVRADHAEARQPVAEVLSVHGGDSPHPGAAKETPDGQHRYALPTLLVRTAAEHRVVPGWRPYEEYVAAVTELTRGLPPAPAAPHPASPAQPALAPTTLPRQRPSPATAPHRPRTRPPHRRHPWPPPGAVRMDTANGPLWLHPDEAAVHPATAPSSPAAPR